MHVPDFDNAVSVNVRYPAAEHLTATASIGNNDVCPRFLFKCDHSLVNPLADGTIEILVTLHHGLVHQLDGLARQVRVFQLVKDNVRTLQEMAANALGATT